jgi:hypothetical protein
LTGFGLRKYQAVGIDDARGFAEGLRLGFDPGIAANDSLEAIYSVVATIRTVLQLGTGELTDRVVAVDLAKLGL